jgi:unsaturated rhamnogalacturonyl hydrolase
MPPPRYSQRNVEQQADRTTLLEMSLGKVNSAADESGTGKSATEVRLWTLGLPPWFYGEYNITLQNASKSPPPHSTQAIFPITPIQHHHPRARTLRMNTFNRTRRTMTSALVISLALFGCGSDDGSPDANSAATGGAPATGGQAASGGSTPGAGGASAGGGQTASGGADPGNSGGAPASGGVPAAGGSATGGAPPGIGGSATGGNDGEASGGVGNTANVDKYFTDWPEGSAPLDIAAQAASVFNQQTLVTGSGTSIDDDYKHYKDACAWYGALWVAALIPDQALIAGLIAKYEPYKATWSDFEPPTTANSYKGHVDNNVFGIVPLEISKLDTDPQYFQEGHLAADHQMANISSQIRYAIDDMFMITSLQAQAYRAQDGGGDGAEHLNVAAVTMVDYLNNMQRPDGLFPHHRDSSSGFQIAWGRGNGWYAAGMAEIIRDLPDDHPQRDAIFAGYKEMMDALLANQIPQGQAGAGLWKQVVDSADARNWPETSGSAMFAYALVSGVRRGWLDVEVYGPPARDAWIGLVEMFDKSQGKIRDTSNWAYNPSSHSGGPTFAGDEENYYFTRDKLLGDNHGQAPLMWAAAALSQPL